MVSDIEKIKRAIGVTGNALDETITPYIESIEKYLMSTGVKAQNMEVGLVARGVTDVWNYGNGDGELSPYFYQRAGQLCLD